MFDRPLLHTDMLASALADPSFDPEVRAVALALAEWTESALDLNNASFALVRLPNRPMVDLQCGLRLAEAAIRIEPDNGNYLNTLGVAQYRLGQYSEAQATLTRSNQLNGNRKPADLAFLAMIQHRLNQAETTRATLNRLREVMKEPNTAAAEKNQGFLREAESVILNSPELPQDVFAL